MSDTTKDAVPECYPLGIIQEAIASRIPREFSGWREWPGTRVLAQAVIEALKVRETVLSARPKPPVAQVQAEAIRVIADIKAILMDHRIDHLAIRLNDAMKRIDAYENRSTGDQS